MFSEYELKERISRTKTSLSILAHCLPDKGARLKENLKTLEAEQEERRHYREIGIINKEKSIGTMVLRLSNINFVDGISTNKLLPNCPILEELSLIFCGGFKSEDLSIANFALKKLDIQSCYFRESTVKIFGPNMTTISYGGELPADFSFDSLLSLVEADIDIYNHREISAKTFVLIKLFEALSNVKILKMSGPSFLVLSQVDILFSDLPVFNNLIHVEVSSQFDYGGVQIFPALSTSRILFRFLQLSPNLETIAFAKARHSPLTSK
ncbi:hypothetical protein MKX03_020653 [Papaver bracteatum]|nr:hypothetical protein MKX03_020653 [Papaver bracteatum]